MKQYQAPVEMGQQGIVQGVAARAPRVAREWAMLLREAKRSRSEVSC